MNPVILETKLSKPSRSAAIQKLSNPRNGFSKRVREAGNLQERNRSETCQVETTVLLLLGLLGGLLLRLLLGGLLCHDVSPRLSNNPVYERLKERSAWLPLPVQPCVSDTQTCSLEHSCPHHTPTPCSSASRVSSHPHPNDALGHSARRSIARRINVRLAHARAVIDRVERDHRARARRRSAPIARSVTMRLFGTRELFRPRLSRSPPRAFALASGRARRADQRVRTPPRSPLDPQSANNTMPARSRTIVGRSKHDHTLFA